MLHDSPPGRSGRSGAALLAYLLATAVALALIVVVLTSPDSFLWDTRAKIEAAIFIGVSLVSVIVLIAMVDAIFRGVRNRRDPLDREHIDPPAEGAGGTERTTDR